MVRVMVMVMVRVRVRVMVMVRVTVMVMVMVCMTDDLSIFLRLDPATLRRRISDEELALAAFQRHADLVNKILDHIDNGTLEAYLAEWSKSIADSQIRLNKLKVALMSRELTNR